MKKRKKKYSNSQSRPELPGQPFDNVLGDSGEGSRQDDFGSGAFGMEGSNFSLASG